MSILGFPDQNPYRPDPLEVECPMNPGLTCPDREHIARLYDEHVDIDSEGTLVDEPSFRPEQDGIKKVRELMRNEQRAIELGCSGDTAGGKVCPPAEAERLESQWRKEHSHPILRLLHIVH